MKVTNSFRRLATITRISKDKKKDNRKKNCQDENKISVQAAYEHEESQPNDVKNNSGHKIVLQKSSKDFVESNNDDDAALNHL